jgi:hypothetical protein
MDINMQKKFDESLDKISEASYTSDPSTPFIKTNIMPEAFVPGQRTECGFFECDSKL